MSTQVPPTSNVDKLEKKRDIKNAIEAHEGIEKTENALNSSVNNVFNNSVTVPEAMFRAAENVPEELIKSLAFKYVKTINSILSKTLFFLGIELGSDTNDIVEKAKEATDKVLLLTQILVKV